MRGPRQQHPRAGSLGSCSWPPRSCHTQHTCTQTHSTHTAHPPTHRYTHSHSHTPTSVPPGSGAHPHGKGPWGGDSDWCCQGTGGQWAVEWALTGVQPEGLREGQQVEGSVPEPRRNLQALQMAEQGRPVSRLQGLRVPPLLLQVTTAGLTEDTKTPGLGHRTIPTGDGTQLHQNQGTDRKRWSGRPAGLHAAGVHAAGKPSRAHTGDQEALGSLSSWAEGLSQRFAKLLV